MRSFYNIKCSFAFSLQWCHYFQPISKHTDARFLRVHPFTNRHFKFLITIESATFQVSLQRHREQGGWSRSVQWNDCNDPCAACDVSSCIVVLKEHTSRQIICLGRWRNTREVADATVMRKCKWLFLSSCEGSRARFLLQLNFKTRAKMGQMLHCARGLCLKIIII